MRSRRVRFSLTKRRRLKRERFSLTKTRIITLLSYMRGSSHLGWVRLPQGYGTVVCCSTHLSLFHGHSSTHWRRSCVVITDEQRRSRTLSQNQDIEDGEQRRLRALSQNQEIEDGELLPQQEEEKMPIDPNSLTYIDEKLENLFGHLREKFDRESLAGNLGVMFEEYGSFMHDVRSYSSFPAEPRSLHGSEKESLSSEKGLVGFGQKGQRESMLPVGNSKKGRNRLPTGLEFDQVRGMEETVNENNQFVQGQKDNPFMDPIDEHREEERHHHSKSQDAPAESMGTILQIMTSFSIPGGLLLSPLPDNMLQLKKRKREGGHNAPAVSPDTILQIMTSFSIPGGHLLSPLHDSMLQLKKRKREGDNSNFTSNGPESLSVMKIFEEGRQLKHIADNLKNNGLELERTDLYYEAAVKFLQAASLLEPPGFRKSEYGHGIQSMQIYSSTAKLFEYCAHQYERSKLMTAAALVHKCVEVSYMKVAYLKYPNASKDHNELEKSLPKITLIRPEFTRLLNYMNDLNSAFEAITKCRNAVEAAAVELVNDRADRLSSVKEAVNFNIHDVEGFLLVLRPLMASIRQ